MKISEVFTKYNCMVNEAELKVEIFRLIDKQKGETLQNLYQLLVDKLQQEKRYNGEWASLEEGYRAMAADEEREKEALEWAEGTLNTEEL